MCGRANSYSHEVCFWVAAILLIRADTADVLCATCWRFVCLIVALQVRGRVVYFGPTGPACISQIRSITTTLSLQPAKQQSPSTCPLQLQHGKDASSYTPDADIELASDQSAKGAARGVHNVAVDDLVASMNPAEWLMDVFTQADRQGRGGDLANAYDESELKQVRVARGRAADPTTVCAHLIFVAYVQTAVQPESVDGQAALPCMRCACPATTCKLLPVHLQTGKPEAGCPVGL